MVDNDNYRAQHKVERDLLKALVVEQQEQLHSMQQEYKRNVQKLSLLNQLIDVDEGKESKTFEDQVSDILRASSVPMHIREIHEELVSRQIPIPGKGSMENVVARISRAKDVFIREGSGVYRLARTSKIVGAGSSSISKAKDTLSKFNGEHETKGNDHV